MHDLDKQEQFIRLRAEGSSFSRIAQELDVSKPTLIDWSRKFQFEIQNHRTILLEQLQEKWIASCDQRVSTLGERLQKVEAELEKRDLATLTTGQLLALADRLRAQIKREIGPITFTTPVSEIPKDEFVPKVQDWKP